MKEHLAVVPLASSQSVTRNTTAYTGKARFRMTTGFAIVKIKSSAGSITVTQQCSIDGEEWFDAVDTDGTAIGAVISAMTVGSKYIQVSPVLAPWIRYKIVEGDVATTVVSLHLVFQELI